MGLKKTSKVVEINDIINWNEVGQVQFSPKFQRNSVWNSSAKSYLIDTILRGLPIPQIFMRQTIEVATRKTFREIIDGQQRLRAVIDFYENEFPIVKSHNTRYGGLYYKDLDDDSKKQFLEYQLLIETISEEDDLIIYDMFARFNTNNVVLNRQELRNAKYWGEFKVVVYENALMFREFFEKNNIFTDRKFSRMEDAEFISSLLILCIDGIETENQNSIDKIYQTYNESFEEYPQIIDKFYVTMRILGEIYEFLYNSRLYKTKVNCYTLFALVLHQLYGIEGLLITREKKYSLSEMPQNITQFCDYLISFENNYFMAQENGAKEMLFYTYYQDYKDLLKTRTTNKKEREKRVTIISNYILGELDG